MPPQTPHAAEGEGAQCAPYAWLVLLGLIGAGAVSAWVGVALGLYLYAALFLLSLLRAAFSEAREGAVLVAFAFVALARFLPIVMPPLFASPATQLALVSVPLLIASLGVARALGYRLIGPLRLRLLLTLPLFLLLGTLYGGAAFLLLWPDALSASLAPRDLLGPVISLSVGAFGDEVLFRGVLLTALVRLVGPPQGILMASLADAGLYLGMSTGPSLEETLWPLQGLVLFAALTFSWLGLRTRSVLGVGLAHALASVVLFAVLPHLIGTGL